MKALLGIGVIAVVTAAIIGWVMNIVSLWHIATSTGQINYVMAGLRAIGIFVAPLGAVLGWL